MSFTAETDLVEDGLDEDRHVSVWGAEAPDDAEAEPVLAPHQGDSLGGAGGHHVGRETVVTPGASVAHLQPPHHHADLPLGVLEDGGGLLLAGTAEVVAVDGDDLISLHQPPVKVGGPALHHLGDEDARAGLLTDDGESEPSVSLLYQLHVHLLVDLVILPVYDEPHPVGCLSEGVQGEAVGHVPQVLLHHLQNLVSRPQPPVLVGSSSLVHLVDEYCTKECIRPANYGETETHWLALLVFVLDDLNGRVLAWRYLTLGGVNLLLLSQSFRLLLLN